MGTGERAASGRGASRTGFALLLAGGVALWLWGGVPLFQIDSLLPRIRPVLENGGNPGFFHYPALVIYVLCIPYGLMRLGMGAQGVVDFARSGDRAPHEAFFSYSLPGHLVIVLFAALGVIAVRRAARALGLSEAAALAGAACLATALLWVSDSHLVTVDVPMAALVAATAAATLRTVRAAEAPSSRRLVFVGALAGLAAAAKYNGALVLAPVVVALALDALRRRRGLFRALLVPAASACVVFLVCNPWVLLDYATFRKDFDFEVLHARLGHDGYETTNGFAFHLRESLARGYGWIGLVSAGLGFVVALARRGLGAPAKVVLIGFPLLHFSLIGASALSFQRYMLPMLPFLALGTAVLVDALAGRLSGAASARGRSLVVAGLTLVVALPNLARALEHDVVSSRPDVRREVIAVLRRAGLEREKPVFCGDYGGRCVRSSGLRIDVTLGRLSTELPDARTDVLLFDSFSHDRLIYGQTITDFVQPYRGYESWPVLRLSPFTVPREQVPFSPKSLYTPYPPDLAFRRCAGPFIELYFVRERDADAVEAAARELGIAVERTTGASGFFLPRIAERARALGR